MRSEQTQVKCVGVDLRLFGRQPLICHLSLLHNPLLSILVMVQHFGFVNYYCKQQKSVSSLSLAWMCMLRNKLKFQNSLSQREYSSTAHSKISKLISDRGGGGNFCLFHKISSSKQCLRPRLENRFSIDVMLLINIEQNSISHRSVNIMRSSSIY